MRAARERALRHYLSALGSSAQAQSNGGIASGVRAAEAQHRLVVGEEEGVARAAG
jgi:hypothetical protein